MLPKFSDTQIAKMSDITSDIALVALASVALPAILDRVDFAVSIAGILASFIFWALSLWLLKNKS